MSQFLKTQKMDPIQDESNELRIHIAGDYSLSSYYPHYLKQQGIVGKRAMLYPLAKIRDLFSNSFTIVNLECSLHLDYFNKVPKTEPAVYLQGHPSTIDSLKYGNVDVVSLANNHSFDGGAQGLKETLKVLKEHRMDYVGAGASLKDAFHPSIFPHNGFNIAAVAINIIFDEPCIDAPKVTEEDGIAVASLNMDKEGLKRHRHYMTEAIRAARQKGSDIVIVYYHWGDEHTDKVTDKQLALASQAVEAGADLVAGTHQHVVQGLRLYRTPQGKGVPVAFGLGHLVFGAIPNPKERWSIVLECIFQRDPQSQEVSLSSFKALPIVTDPSMDREGSFQPHVASGRDAKRLLQILGRRSKAISSS